HGVGLARPGDAEQHLGAVEPADALDQFLDRGRLVALRLVFGLDHERLAAFGFFRARRPMRRPDFYLAVLALEFGTAVADQRVQRIRGRGDAERLHLVARRPRHRGGVLFLRGEAELLRQLRIERGDGGRGAVIGRRKFPLRRFVEAGTRFVAAGTRGETPTLTLPRERERGRWLRSGCARSFFPPPPAQRRGGVGGGG